MLFAGEKITQKTPLFETDMTFKEEENTLKSLKVDTSRQIRYMSMKVVLGKFYDGLKLLDENQEEILKIDFYQSVAEIDLGFTG